MLNFDGLLQDMRVGGAGARGGPRPLFFALVERKFSPTAPCHGARRFMGFLAGSVFAAAALAQPGHADGPASATQTARVAMTKKNVSPFHTVSLPTRAKDYYESIWGVDNLLVRRTASGNLIRFSYRVTDPVRAKGLGEKVATPYIYGQRSHALLHIPVMENIGQLRQTGISDVGQEHWMVFSNKGDFVKSGDRVNVIIGTFHADGLLVE